MMKVVCSWCHREMGEKMGPDGLTTHGICKTCFEEVENKLEARRNANVHPVFRDILNTMGPST